MFGRTEVENILKGTKHSAAAQKKLFRYAVSQSAYCCLREHAKKRTCRYVNSFIFVHFFKYFDA